MTLIRQKKTILCLTVLSAGVFHTACPTGETSDVDVRALALGNVKALSQKVSNPAGLPFLTHKELGATVYNRFGMKELNTVAVYALLPNGAIDAAALLSSYGYADYRLLCGQVNLAKKLSPVFAAGINVVCINENSILHVDAQTGISAGAGFCLHAGREWVAAFAADNLLSAGRRFPATYSLGIRRRMWHDGAFLLETGYETGARIAVKAGLEYRCAEIFFLRAGFKTLPNTPSFGFAYVGPKWQTETTFLFHPVLGISAAAGISCLF